MPWTIVHQAPLPMGFFRQEYWNGLPFPPSRESSQAKDQTCGISYLGRQILYHWTTLKVKVAQLCPTLCDPMDSTVHGILQARILEWVAFPFSRGSSQPRDQTQVSYIADSWPAEPQGKPKNIGLDSQSLLQWIFSTEELNSGLLHCRRIIYQLSYQETTLFTVK